MSVTRASATPDLVTFPAARNHRPLAGTKLYCSMTEAHVYKRLVRGCTQQCSSQDVNLLPVGPSRRPPSHSQCGMIIGKQQLVTVTSRPNSALQSGHHCENLPFPIPLFKVPYIPALCQMVQACIHDRHCNCALDLALSAWVGRHHRAAPAAGDRAVLASPQGQSLCQIYCSTIRVLYRLWACR